MNTLELYRSILGDVGNFSLVIFGFSVTLFTVIYSLIIAKREQLKEYSDKLKEGSKDPLIYQRHSFSVKFIEKFKKINVHLIIIIFATILIFLGSLFSKYIATEEDILKYFFFFFTSLTGVLIIYIVIILIITVKDYLRLSKT